MGGRHGGRVGVGEGGGRRGRQRQRERDEEKEYGEGRPLPLFLSCSVFNLFEACERAEEGVSGGDKRKRRRLLAAVGLEAGVADVLQARQRREEHLLLPGVHAHRRHTRRAVHLRPPP